MLPCLGQNLHRHILRNHILLNERPHKLVLRLRCRRESNLNLLKPDIHKHLEKLQLFLKAHRLNQRLIAIP